MIGLGTGFPKAEVHLRCPLQGRTCCNLLTLSCRVSLTPLSSTCIICFKGYQALERVDL